MCSYLTVEPKHRNYHQMLSTLRLNTQISPLQTFGNQIKLNTAINVPCAQLNINVTYTQRIPNSRRNFIPHS